MKETEVGDSFVYEILTQDTQLKALMGGTARVDVDLSRGALPGIVYTAQADNDVNTMDGSRIMMDSLYLIKVIGQGSSYVPIQPIANRIDALLHKAEGTVAAGFVFSCVREAVVRYSEVTNGQEYKHLGGNYRLLVQAP